MVFAGSTRLRSLWTPERISTALWLDAADASTINTVSGAVSQWNDKSGNGKNASQSTATNRPSYNATGFNGRPVVSFDGSNDFLENTTNGITSGTYTGRLNAFYVATRNSSGGALLTERTSKPVAAVQWIQLSSIYYIYSDGANVNSNQRISVTTYAKLSTTGAVVCQVHQPGVRATLFVNGEQEVVNAVEGAGVGSNISGATGFRIGGREGSVGQSWNGGINEIIVTSNNFTVLERQKIEGYLAHKWGLEANLPSNHPYKEYSPKGV